MRKILFLLFIIFAACQKQIVPVKSRAFNDPWNPVYVGAAPNDGTGYTLRNSFIQLNTTDAATLDSLGNIYTEAQVDALLDLELDIADTAAMLSTYYNSGDTETGIALADSNITTEGGYVTGYVGRALGVRQSDLPISQRDTINNVYYVSNDGDDDNDGLSPGSSWAHHPWMSTWTGSTTLEAGDVVCMKRGDTWTITSPSEAYMTVAQSGSSQKYITTTAYGVGAKPLIQITTDSDYPVVYINGKSYLEFANLHIKHNSSTYNSSQQKSGFYLYGNPHDIVFQDNEIDNIPHTCIMAYVNCYNITIGDTLATKTATSTAFSNHLHDFGYAGIILMGSNSATDKSNFNIYQNYIHSCTRSVAADNAYGISITATTTSNGWPNWVYVRYNYVEDIDTWSAISSHGCKNSYFQNNYVHNFGTNGIGIHSTEVGALTPTCDSIYIEDNIAENTEGEYVTTNENAFIGCYGVSNSYMANDIFIRRNRVFYTNPLSVENLFFGIVVNRCDDVLISENHVYNGSGTIDTNYPAISCWLDGTKYDMTFENNFIEDWVNAISLDADEILGTANVRNNIITSANTTTTSIYVGANTNSSTILNIYNNTIIGGTYSLRLFDITSGSVVNIKNNIFGFRSAGDYTYIRLGTVSGTLNCDYNQFWNVNGATPFYANADWRNWTYWTTTLSYDTNSPNFGHGDADFDPLLKNTSGTFGLEADYELQTTSPCINAGTNVGIDFLGTAKDIGAKEMR